MLGVVQSGGSVRSSATTQVSLSPRRTQSPIVARPLAKWLLRAAFAVSVFSLSLGETLSAQGRLADQRVVGVLEGVLGVTTLAGGAGGLLGVSAGVWVGRFFLGGSGAGVPGPLSISGPLAQNSELHFGYGGVRIGARAWRSDQLEAVFDVLAGAGRARLRDPVVGRELGADNFLALEPALRVRKAFVEGLLQAGASVGFRLVWGVEDLPGLDAADLRGPTLTLALSLERR